MQCVVSCGKCCKLWPAVKEIVEAFPDREHSEPCPYLGKTSCNLSEEKKPIECRFYLCPKSAFTRLLKAKQAKDPSIKQVTLRDMMIDLEHRKWSHWATQMLDTLSQENVLRWRKIASMNSDEFTEEQLHSDAVWADQALAFMKIAQTEVPEKDNSKLQ